MSRSPLERPVQVAYAVSDVAAAAAAFATSTGAGPFFVVPHIEVVEARVNGTDAPFDHSSAYGQWGDLMVELVEEHTPPLVAPAGAMHHMAFMVPSLDDAVEWCGAAGWAEVLWARTAAGQEFTFRDARAQLGHLVELYEPSDRLVAFYSMVAHAARAWNGDHPVRSLR